MMSLGYGTLHQGWEKREKGWNSWNSETGKQLPQRANAGLAAFTFCTGLMDGFSYLDGQG